MTTRTSTANGRTRANPPPPKGGRWVRGNRTQCQISIEPKLLEEIDRMAVRKHLSRSALLALWMGERLEQENARAP